VLHAVKLESGQPIDSVTTDAGGRYGFRVSALDTAATYLVSVEHGSIGYFSDPLLPAENSSDTISTIVVYDTSYTQPRVYLADRNMIVRSARSDGSRRVIELFTIKNDGLLTRISADTSSPVWEGAMPAEAVQFELGDTDVSPDAVYLRENAVAISAPIPPGQKQILFSYLLPGGATEVSIEMLGYVDRMHVLLEDSAAAVIGGGLEFHSVDEIGESSFYRYGGGAFRAGEVMSLELPSPPLSPQKLVGIIAAIVAFALALALVLWARRRARQPHHAAEDDADSLAEMVAALDSEFETRAGGATETERSEYDKRRAELKARLSEMLAREGGED
jgi:hypothetical protein